MTGAILLLICLILIGLSIRSFQNGLRRAQTERVLGRLAEGQPQLVEENSQWSGVERMFLRAGLGKPSDNLGVWLAVWALGAVLGLMVAGWIGLLAMLVLPPLLLRLYIAWRYQRRIKRMIEQLPQLLDHTVRSLKAGRTLADAVLGGIEVSEDPLKHAMSRIQRNVQLGVSLPESAHDFAEFYERDEFRLFALGLKVNHRYGGNASELLENLIVLIRERDQGARRLRAMTGETRMTALVLGMLPVFVVAFFMATNPNYMIKMWQDGGGQHMLLTALAMQIIGSVALWRMVRSV